MSAACTRAEGASVPAGPEVSLVRLEPVDRAPVERPIRASGLCRLKSEFELSFKVPGVVQQIGVEEGQRVRRGQVLARLDDTELGAGLRQAQAAREKALRDLARAEQLQGAGTLPIADLQNARTGAAVAEETERSAAFNAGLAALVAPDDGVVSWRRLEPGEIVAAGHPVLRVLGRAKGAVVRVALLDKDAL
ncbi:MAG: biotin/lipoyl-binding protein, partial [Deltaproteobacteria bacterium]|nr:biotin/lipoyl-binding protein [Deltaproteobacteria bacterium]